MEKNIAMLIAMSFLLGCSAPNPSRNGATAELKDKDGRTVGVATLRDGTGGVLVYLEVNGLSAGQHAVHVHAVGKCEGPGFASAGGHFNPRQKKHGHKNSAGAHAGDLPNMLVAQDGTGRLEILTDAFSLAAGHATSVFDADGSAMVIHAGIDDYLTDPSGNSGDRVACGVVVANR